MCTVLLPPGVNPVAVKYIISDGRSWGGGGWGEWWSALGNRVQEEANTSSQINILNKKTYIRHSANLKSLSRIKENSVNYWFFL